MWRDTANMWQDYDFGGAVNQNPATVRAANRVIAAQGAGGSIAAFPPPHNFFWTREIEFNLGYDWYRKDSDSQYSFGVREAESEEDPAYAGRGEEDRRQNFALRSARPGTWQRMPVYFYVSPQPAQATLDSALAFTRQDHYKPLPEYMVMASHFHSSMVGRLQESGHLDDVFPDAELAKATGVNIFAPIDGGFSVINTVPRERDAAAELFADLVKNRLKNLSLFYEAARLHSGKNFLVMPNEEVFRLAGKEQLGGHNDLLISHPVYWTNGREEGQSFEESDPKYGKVYHIGSPADLLEMAHREDMIILHATSALQRFDGLPRRHERHGAFPRRCLPRRGVPLGDGLGWLRAAAVRIPLHGLVRRHE